MLGDGRVLFEAVVNHYFSNPQYDLDQSPENDPDKTYKESLISGVNKVLNYEFITTMPRGSITATVVSDNAAWRGGEQILQEVFYPMFPHMMLPLKPGEKVWVIYENINRSISQKGFWLSRISSDIRVDDINYTHDDRRFVYNQVLTSNTSAEQNEEGSTEWTDDDIYDFPNGGCANIGASTLPGETPYTTIIENSPAYQLQFTGEPVPRFSPRAGDFVLQGSNNTLISLGQDRPSTDGPDRGEGIKPEPGRGTIDIVVGRGQDPSTAAIDAEDLGVISNTREYDEINKFPTFDEAGTPNPNEGDPDFATDLSRIYVSMKTDGDANFLSGSDGTWPSSLNGDTTVTDSGEGPYAVIKSTFPRVISKSDGSIKIIHEAGSSIVMDSSGNVQIQCAGVIELGKTAETNLMEWLVRGDTLKSKIESLVDTFNNHTHMYTDMTIFSAASLPTQTPTVGDNQTWDILSSVIKGE
tara:strand:- start:306 stop:1712 length:1407 start_codon:yes stop_codon:yes gene_type:complete